MKRCFILITLFLVLAIALPACAPQPAPTTQAPAQPPAATEVLAATEVPAATKPPAPAPTAMPTSVRSGSKDIILSTTTSTQDSGLLDVLVPDFTQKTGYNVKTIAVGTGQALKMGEQCNADVLLVHAPASEKDYMSKGFGADRKLVMHNDFIIVGPAEDPAGIKGETSGVDAFKKIAAAQAPFISRGDQSGTNTKELAIWKAAGIEPKGDWYISAGQGMGAVLNMTNEQQAYTLSDRATYLARAKKGLGLEILVEGDKTLFNPYGVITVNPEKCPNVNSELGNKFVDWLVSVPVQQKIGEFGKDQYGQALFTPDSTAWKNR